MGFLKKITRPISRVLDKIVPNEIKPALPFLAAAAPFMAPGIMGIGGNTMLSRALLSGGLNLGAQLAQEGSEGDFNPLSVALASGIGALSAPGAAEKIRSFGGITEGVAPEGFKQGGLEYLAKSADFLGPAEGGAVDILGKGGTKAGFDMATAKAASVPLTQGTMDLAFAEQNRLNKQQIIDDALGGLGEGASDADRALAIRLAMQQYGFTDDEIEETITSAGYKDGGIIGLQVEMIEGKKDGGRIGFRDGSSTGNFGADRYASELIGAYKDILGKGDMFFTDVEKEIIEKGEYPSPDKMKEFQDRYENLEKEYDKESDKFGNIDLQDSLLDKDAIKYYNKKVKDLEDREKKLTDKEEKLSEVMYTDLDVSGILRTPEFQEWYRLWKVNDPKADDLPNAEYFENMMFDVKRLRPDIMKTKYDVEMKDGGLMNLGGKEMDLRGGGFVPIGKKERADDVPARLSKNEFVMTADAVRAAGGGSVNKGAKRMYDLMDKLEARV